MESEQRPPAYRWIIEALLIAAFSGQMLTWLAPAPILAPILNDLRINLASGGLIISIIALCISIFSLAGAFVVERLGTLRTLLLGLWLMAGGAVLSGYSSTFSALLACRVLQGIGFGLTISPPGTLVMEWFAEREWPYINMVNALCTYVGLTAVFAMTAPIYFALGSSWRAVLRDYGFGVAAVALLWTILGRERAGARLPLTEGTTVGRSALSEVLRMRNVIIIATGTFGGMWVFQLYSAFLPQFFREYHQMSLTDAARMTAILPLTGIFASAGGGFATALTGLRKPFCWPVASLTLIGCIGVVTLPSVGAMRLALVLVGIGAAGSLAPITTLMMELPGMTPEKAGSSLALTWSVGYAGAFVSPFLGGALAEAIGLRSVMLVFLTFQLILIVGMYLLPETGPGRAGLKLAAAAPAD